MQVHIIFDKDKFVFLASSIYEKQKNYRLKQMFRNKSRKKWQLSTSVVHLCSTVVHLCTTEQLYLFWKLKAEWRVPISLADIQKKSTCALKLPEKLTTSKMTFATLTVLTCLVMIVYIFAQYSILSQEFIRKAAWPQSDCK